MGMAKKVNTKKRRPRSDDPSWDDTANKHEQQDYPDDEASSVYTLDNLVNSFSTSKSTVVVLPDAVEAQLEDTYEQESSDSSSEDEESIPPPPAAPPVMTAIAKTPSQEEREKKHCDRKYYVGGSLLALVCIAAIVVVSVIAPSNSSPQTVTSSATGGESLEPPASREEAFSRMLTDISSTDALQTSGSPQSKALDWLVNYDAAQLDPSTENEREVQERYILAVFYYSLGGTDWFDSFYFLSQNHVCNWRNDDFGMGVTCDEGEQTVTGFRFGPNNLQGNLPDEIFLLQGLRTFQVIMNPGLTGPIPSSVETLQNLKTLNLNKNSLNGEIPDSLLYLPSLTTLWMDENSFQGTIPIIQDGSTTLQWWSCNNCGLTGRVPDTLRIPNL